MTIPGTPGYYREKAKGARVRAEAAQDEKAKQQLLRVAILYEELAERAEARSDKSPQG